MARNLMGNKKSRIRRSKPVNGFEGQKKGMCWMQKYKGRQWREVKIGIT